MILGLRCDDDKEDDDDDDAETDSLGWYTTGAGTVAEHRGGRGGEAIGIRDWRGTLDLYNW